MRFSVDHLGSFFAGTEDWRIQRAAAWVADSVSHCKCSIFNELLYVQQIWQVTASTVDLASRCKCSRFSKSLQVQRIQ
jgi:hypothetical protein